METHKGAERLKFSIKAARDFETLLMESASAVYSFAIMSTSKRNETVVFLVAALLLSSGCWILLPGSQQLDSELYSRLLTFSHSPPHHGAPLASIGAPFHLILLIVLSVTAFMAGVKLRRWPRLLVAFQLFCASLLVQCVASWSFGTSGHPMGYVLTIALSMSGGFVARRMVSREQMHEANYYELVLRNQEIQETRLQLVKQDEIERRTLAADLHDQVLNDLKTINGLIADYAEQPSKASAELMQELVSSAMNEVRDVMDSLCPSVLEHIGFIAAVEDCLRRGGERAGFKMRFKSSIDEDALSCLSKVELSLLFRLVQETVTNICKHAQAKIVKGSIVIEDQFLKITIADDGKGMDLSVLNTDSRGIRFMRQRGDLIGATIAWQSVVEQSSSSGAQGTEVE